MIRTLAVSLLLVLTSQAAADDQGTDFGPQARALFRVGACGGDESVPERLPAKAVASHCKTMTALYASYRRAWADKAGAYIADLRPAAAPKTVVYPFGGGDLTSALVVFPDATEITTLSLEAPGDVRAIDTIKSGQLTTDLGTIGRDIRRLYRSAHSTTKSLQAAAYSELPGSLLFALAGLAVFDFEPVSLRYFDINTDGTLAYLSNDELDRRVAAVKSNQKAKKRFDASKHLWLEMESVFSNVEIQYRKRGDAKAPLRTYRHILANLDDAHMTTDDRVLDHLRAKGQVSVMTKAASFLLWFDDFSQVRTYLLQHMGWMVSDASGIPPSYARSAGFEQLTYGVFTGPYFIQDKNNTRGQFVKLWKSQPLRDLPFRFGYPDENDQNHLLVTRPRSTPPAKP
ncbi:MAG: hypothetical protein H0T42_20845 [Deltaproteobacteria bacterium]|nr:hypothetical protein [Deltaproteobacteria bacterium]